MPDTVGWQILTVQTLVSHYQFSMGTERGLQILHSQIILLDRKINALQKLCIFYTLYSSTVDFKHRPRFSAQSPQEFYSHC